MNNTHNPSLQRTLHQKVWLRAPELSCWANRATWIAWYSYYHTCMIELFKDKANEDIFNGVNSKETRKRVRKHFGKLRLGN